MLSCTIFAIGVIACPGSALASESPVMALSFDDGSGVSARDSVSSHDATIHGATWTEAGKYGSALEFDGEDDYLSIPDDDALDFTDGFTLEAWVKPEALAVWAPVITKETSGFYSYQLYAGGETEGVPEGRISDKDSSWEEVAGAKELPLEGWSYLSYTYDGEAARLYVDGELTDTSLAPNAQVGTGELKIGGNKFSEFFDGTLDEVRLYDGPLSQGDIEDDEEIPGHSPFIEVEGPLVESSTSHLVGPDSDLVLSGIDRGATFQRVVLTIDEEERRSISLDDEALGDGAVEDCTGTICELSYTFPAAVGNDVDAGLHTFGIEVEDNAERSTSIENEVELDVNPPSLTLSGTLAEADGDALEDESIGDLLISTTDGESTTDSGIASILVEVNGRQLLKLEPECTPECIASVVESIEFNRAQWEEEWEEAPTELVVSVKDGAGNDASESLIFRPYVQVLEPVCPNLEQTIGTGGEVFSPEEAVEELTASVPGALLPNQGSETLDPSSELEPYVELDETPSLPEGAYFEAGTLQGGWIAGEAAGPWTAGPSVCLLSSETTADETDSVSVLGGLAVVRANSAPETDTLLRPNPLGTSVVESFRGPKAPEDLSWVAEIKPPAELQEMTDGGVAVVDRSGMDLNFDEPPELPENYQDPSALAELSTQLEITFHELAVANNEIEGEILSVFPPAVSVNGEGNTQTQALALSEVNDEITVHRPAGSVALVLMMSGQPEANAICAQSSRNSTGLDRSVCTDLASSNSGNISNFTWIDEDRLLYSLDTSEDPDTGEPSTSRLYEVTEDDSSITALTDPQYQYHDPRASTDGSRIVLTRCGADGTHCGVYVMDADGNNQSLVFADSLTGQEYHPAFGSKDNEIYFFHDKKGKHTKDPDERQIYFINVNGDGLRQVTDAETIYLCSKGFPPEVCNSGLYWQSTNNSFSVSHDGKSIVFSQLENLWSVPSAAKKAVYGGPEGEIDLLTSGGDVYNQFRWPSFSADDGEILYYHGKAEEPEVNGVYAMEADGSKKHRLFGYAGKEGARYPTIGPDGEVGAFAGGSGLAVFDTEGSEVRSVTDGDDDGNLAQVAEAGDEAQVAVAEEVEERRTELLSTIHSTSYEVSDGEKAFCAANLVNAAECYYFYGDKLRAEGMRDKLFTAKDQRDFSTQGNAFQHGFWTALMAGDSPGDKYVTDGLLFALLHEGDGPYSWDSRMDMVNDFVGNKYWNQEGANLDQKDVCEGILAKARDAIFIGAHINPYRWANIHHIGFHRLIYRKLRSRRGLGPVVRPNGRTCAGTW